MSSLFSFSPCYLIGLKSEKIEIAGTFPIEKHVRKLK